MGLSRLSISPLAAICAVAMLSAAPARLQCSNRKDAVEYGAGLIVNVPAPEAEVAQAVQEVVQNGVIRGSKEYNKDEYITGAMAATDSRLFPAWTEEGKVFYKVRLHVLDPRNFKDSADVGTLTVRYIVMGQDEKSTILRIEAVFVEDFRHTVHPSNGSVEGSEYKDIHGRIEAMESVKQEAAQAEKEKQEYAQKKFLGTRNEPAGESLARPDKKDAVGSASSTTTSVQSLEDRVKELRKQVERLVKAPGAPLKSAPFHTASNLRSLPAAAEVLIVISTPYWYGVETHDGQHGWMFRDDLEELP